MINISKAAANELKRLQHTRQQMNSRLRLKVETGGCLGLFYVLEFEQLENLADRLYESNDIRIVIDEKSWDYIKGLTIDYSEDLMGGAFRFHNPNTSNTCGCGNSFSMEV